MNLSDSRAPLIRTVIACVALGALLVSCGDDDDSATATTVADVCADREALRESVDVLTNVDVVAEGTNGVSAAVSDVEDDLAVLRSSAGDAVEPQVQAVEDALGDLETAVDEIDSGGASAALAAMSDLASSAATLLDSLEAGAVEHRRRRRREPGRDLDVEARRRVRCGAGPHSAGRS